MYSNSMSTKNYLATTLLLFLWLSTSAQVFPYELSVLSDPYNDLTAPISINNDDVWDDPSYLTSTGFDIEVFGDVINTLNIIQPGAQIVTLNESLPDTVQVLSPYMADIMNANDSMVVSPISYQIEGPPGNAILKLEWKNVGFYGEWDAANTFYNTTNFQVWFYQSGSIIEYRYGPNTIKSGDQIHYFGAGPIVLLAQDALINGTGWSGLWCLSGNPLSPSITTINSGQQPIPSDALISEPPSGTVYRFAPISTGINEKQQGDVSLWPTQCNEQIFLSGRDAQRIDFFDATGRQMASHRLSAGGKLTIDVSAWSAGYYIAHSEKGQVLRFIKS